MSGPPAPPAAEGLAAQVAGLGLPPALAAQMLAAQRPPPEPLAVMPANWEAVRVFVAMGTQWRRAGLGAHPAGLDYAALPAACAGLGVALGPDLLARLRAMEGAALAAMLERAR